MKQGKKREWTRLDNASKIFPATCNNKDTKVYRLTCELYEEVDKNILQQALNMTLNSFPIYKSVLRKGVFWYYFEQSDLPAVVELESQPLCAPIYIKDKRNLLFRVIYFNNRINVETFHALSDGAGAVWFIETLVFHYLNIRYKDKLGDKLPTINHKASISQKMDDSFNRYYIKNNSSLKKPKENIKKEYSKSYQIPGNKNIENRTKLVEGSMSVKEVLGLAHNYNTTLTIFLTSLLLYSIHKERPIKMKSKPVVLSVPINLRQYFESATARNFFSTMTIAYDFDNNSHELVDIIDSVAEDFNYNLTENQLYSHLNKFMALERNPITRIVPLPLKDFSLKIADKINDRKITSSISNIGKINLPVEFEDYINQFSVCVSARRPLITLCSYKDRLVISFTSPFEETDIQRRFFQFISENGIKVEILSNL